MKRIILTSLALGAGAWTLSAQAQPAGPDGPPPGGHRPPPPVLLALDANHDGVIDAGEIANASVALKALDKNGDGKLTSDELRPTPPDGTNQPAFRPPPPPGGRKHPLPPVMAALDTNGDGTLDADEIANASTSLLKLDKNGDGKLTRDELRPKGMGRPPGPPPNGDSGSIGVPPGDAPDGPPPFEGADNDMPDGPPPPDAGD